MKKYNILDEQNTPERILQEDLAQDTEICHIGYSHKFCGEFF